MPETTGNSETSDAAVVRVPKWVGNPPGQSRAVDGAAEIADHAWEAIGNRMAKDRVTETRKTIFIREVITSDAFGEPCRPVCRVAALAVVRNPLAGRFEADLTPLFEIGAELGTLLADEAVTQLRGVPVSYGKAAIVGLAGDLEHGGAVIHPKLGAPMRLAAGGGQSVIPSNVKLGGPGTSIDLPLGHKDNAWSFDHFDTMTLFLADGPLPDEIVLCLAYADGGRPNPRCGSGPVSA